MHWIKPLFSHASQINISEAAVTFIFSVIMLIFSVHIIIFSDSPSHYLSGHIYIVDVSRICPGLGLFLPTLTSVSLALLTTVASASPSRNGCVSKNLG